MKHVLKSRKTGINYLFDDEADDVHKHLFEIIQSDPKKEFSVRPFSPDNDTEEMWKIYFDKVSEKWPKPVTIELTAKV